MHRVKISSLEPEETTIEKEEDSSAKQLEVITEEDINEYDPEIDNDMSIAKAIVEDIQSILNLAEITYMKMRE